MTLDTVRQAFEDWRRHRKSQNEPIPERLWRLVTALPSTHKPWELRKALGINNEQLKRYCLSIADQKPISVVQNGFIEAVLPSTAPVDCTLTLQGSSRTLTLQFPIQQLAGVLPLLEAYL